jgi:hypothetical protein
MSVERGIQTQSKCKVWYLNKVSLVAKEQVKERL